MAESGFERFRRTWDTMQFETLPLFSRPYLNWNLQTDYAGRRLIYRPSTESLVDDARRMLDRFRLTTGAVLLVESQTEGRSRTGRPWVSPPDVNLYFTLVLFPAGPDAVRSLAYVAPLAIARAIEEVSAAKGAPIRPDLKWPDDILIDGRKVAGVVIETAVSGAGEPVALAGAGINVNLDVAAYPEIADTATSLKEALGFSVPREEVLASFCNHVEELYEQALSGSRAPFQAWRERLVTLGQEVVATGTTRTVRGRAVDIDEDAALIIETPDGSRVRVEASEVTLSAEEAV